MVSRIFISLVESYGIGLYIPHINWGDRMAIVLSQSSDRMTHPFYPFQSAIEDEDNCDDKVKKKKEV